ncbi:hypothetical protein ACOSQ3_017799 [Xanthoceras sorbifolium]
MNPTNKPERTQLKQQQVNKELATKTRERDKKKLTGLQTKHETEDGAAKRRQGVAQSTLHAFFFLRSV